MLAAEKRYHIYEEQYYDNCTTSQNENKRPITITTGEKVKLIFLLISLGVMCIVMIMSSAYTSQIKYNINNINAEISKIEGEIENIIVEIEQESKIVSVEEKALNELGMIYPSSEEIIFLNSNTFETSDFAAVLREEAFN